MKSLNLAIAFLIELCLLVAFGYWGFHTTSNGILHWVLGVGVPLAVAGLWSVVAAPQSERRLKPMPLFIFKLCIFVGGVAALFAAGQHGMAIALGAVSAASLVLGFVWKQ